MKGLHSNKKEKPTVISIISTKSGMGKTTLIEGLINILKSRNYSVGVLKYDVRKFDIDKNGKDSYRFTKAGADNVVIASTEKLAMIQILREEKTIDEILDLFYGVDIVIIEGFKKNNYPKIEVHRKDIDHNLLCENLEFNIATFMAIASDETLDVNIPVLDLNDIVNISDFIENKFLLND